MRQKYLLEWLDTLIGETLNPEKTHVREVTSQQAGEIINRIRKETATIKSKFKHQIFSLTREKHIRLFLQNHYISIQILHGQVTERKENHIFQQKDLGRVLMALKTSLEELLSFLETWFVRYLNLEKLSRGRDKKAVTAIKQQAKVLCNLSTDQTALVLRAADELRILQARSMRNVFKMITPHLSTPHKKDLSYDAMRVSAYKAEDKDKQIAIAKLKKMIEKIKGY